MLDPHYHHLTIESIEGDELEHIRHLELNGKWFEAAPSIEARRYERKCDHEDIMRERELEALVLDILECLRDSKADTKDLHKFERRIRALELKGQSNDSAQDNTAR